MSLVDLLSKRNAYLYKTTNKILYTYSDIFDEVFKNMCNDEMTVNWVSIDFHPHSTVLLNLIGVSRFRIGVIMHPEVGDPIHIDEDNVGNYTKNIRIILPIMLVDDADIDGLGVFVREYSELVLGSSQGEMELMAADDKFLMKYFACFKDGVSNVIVPKPKDSVITAVPKVEHEEFDLTELELDEVQLQQLRLLRPEGQS